MTTLASGTSPSVGGTAVLTNVVAIDVEIDTPEVPLEDFSSTGNFQFVRPTLVGLEVPQVTVDTLEVSTSEFKSVIQLLGELIANSETGTGGARQILIQ